MSGYKKCQTTRSMVMRQMPRILEWKQQGQKTKEILQRLREEGIFVVNAPTLNAYIHEFGAGFKIKYINSRTTGGFSEDNQ